MHVVCINSHYSHHYDYAILFRIYLWGHCCPICLGLIILSAHTCALFTQDINISYIMPVVSFSRRVLSFSRRVLSFSRRVLSFSRRVLSFSRRVLSFSRRVLSFSRRVLSFSRRVLSFSRRVLSFSRRVMSFSRRVLSFSRRTGGQWLFGGFNETAKASCGTCVCHLEVKLIVW